MGLVISKHMKARIASTKQLDPGPRKSYLKKRVVKWQDKLGFVNGDQ